LLWYSEYLFNCTEGFSLKKQYKPYKRRKSRIATGKHLQGCLGNPVYRLSSIGAHGTFHDLRYFLTYALIDAESKRTKKEALTGVREQSSVIQQSMKYTARRFLSALPQRAFCLEAEVLKL
jgi:hypothetical protein